MQTQLQNSDQGHDRSETTCQRCGGTGKVMMNDREVKCVYCRGTGKASSMLTK